MIALSDFYLEMNATGLINSSISVYRINSARDFLSMSDEMIAKNIVNGNCIVIAEFRSNEIAAVVPNENSDRHLINYLEAAQQKVLKPKHWWGDLPHDQQVQLAEQFAGSLH